MKTTASLLAFMLLYWVGFSQHRTTCIADEALGYWHINPFPNQDTIRLTYIDTSLGRPSLYYIVINSDSVFPIKRGIWRCGNDESLKEPLGRWEISKDCSLSYFTPGATTSSLHYKILAREDNTLMLVKIN